MTGLSRNTLRAMAAALDDEYKARATYRAVIATHGPVRPFTNIVEAEERHAAALLSLYERYGATPPPDRWAGAVAAPRTLENACRDGVAAEIDNAALYDRLAELTADAPDEVRQVFANLRRASQERHLPAFQRCLGRAAAGRGRGHGCRAA